jgi:parvulin-like peptidyl-prolyl isomerase
MIVGIVNDYKISEEEFWAELKIVMDQMNLSEPNPEAKRRAIEQLIDGYLLINEAKSSDIEINLEDIEDAYLELMLKFDDKQDFDLMLEEKSLSSEIIKNRIKNELIVKKFIKQNFPPPDDIPLEKLDEIYQENLDSFRTNEMIHAYHILIKEDNEESLQKILQLRNQINSKEDFLEMAKNFSDCPSCCQCGDLGFFSRGQMVKEFEDIAFNLKINEISLPVKTAFGYHLILVSEKKKSKIASFEEVKESLIKRLKAIDCELQLIRHIKKLRQNADIVINHEFIERED